MSIRVFLGLCVVALFIVSCTQTPAPAVKVKSTTPVKANIVEVQDSQYYIQQARLVFAKDENVTQRNAYLLVAAEKLQQEQHPQTSVRVLNALIPEINQQSQLSQAYLLLAENHQQLNHAESLNLLKDILPKIDPFHVDNSRLAQLQYTLHINQQEWLTAANQLLKTELDSIEKSLKIWQAISQLNRKKLEQARWRYPELLPWIQLATITQNHGLSPVDLKQQVADWQRQNEGHPLQQNLPKKLLKAIQLQPIQAKNIAVLLPLSGRLASQGKMLKEGILTAYMQDSNKQLDRSPEQIKLTATSTLQEHLRSIRFFDSTNRNPQQLNDLIEDYDVVIGPLLKDKIQGLKKILAKDKILLALNRIDDQLSSATIPLDQETKLDTTSELNHEHYYFSLAPEDEAEQLAEHIHDVKLQQPIIFADNNNITKRMANAFIEQWQELNSGSAPSLTIFTSNKDMRKSVAEMLDVEQSKNRIKLMEQLADVEVISKERNRRDIDSVVLFANPEQTSLLNPIIEASLSSFAEVSLSVFATSRSYSQAQTTSSFRDLRHLTFSDMPWLLPEHDWPELAVRTKNLWPQRKDSLARLYAMGYDAYSFIPKLRQLKTLPQLTSKGLTGQINIEASGIIRRQLPWAKIEKNRVTILGMD